ncbi:methyltransferase domain-containing protein [Actinopolyspora erythraea]|nr:class I SAM-dependent methyltransferase [Actinopolyspora erythraea]
MEHAAHYDALAGTFTDHWAYSRAFVAWMTTALLDRLQPHADAALADVGSGPGLYAAALAERAQLAHPIDCVEPSPAMRAELPTTVTPVAATAEHIATGPEATYDGLWVKEALHHVPHDERPAVLAGLFRRLRPGGRMLLVTWPRRVEHPLFPAAHEHLARVADRLPPGNLADELDQLGGQVTLTYDSFLVTMPTERWIDMVRARYLSLLARFTDDELAEGIAHIRRDHPETTVAFRDRYAFITARR